VLRLHPVFPVPLRGPRLYGTRHQARGGEFASLRGRGYFIMITSPFAQEGLLRRSGLAAVVVIGATMGFNRSNKRSDSLA